MDILNSAQAPILPLTKIILTENPYVKERSNKELRDLAHQKDEYRVEYAQSL